LGLTGSARSERVIGLAIEVHRHLGPGLLESAYEACLRYELGQAALPYQQQVPLPIRYKEVRLDCGYRMDLVVGEELIVEVKAVERLLPIHEAQMLTYLRLSGISVGLLMNFNAATLRQGLRRMVQE
jgi:GxxExxY protein